MIVRVITYHSLPDKDVEGWLQGVASELRGVFGMRHVTYVRSTDNPSIWGAIMRFRTVEDLKAYKATGTYKRLVQSIRETWLDESKPVTDKVFEVLDF